MSPEDDDQLPLMLFAPPMGYSTMVVCQLSGVIALGALAALSYCQYISSRNLQSACSISSLLPGSHGFCKIAHRNSLPRGPAAAIIRPATKIFYDKFTYWLICTQAFGQPDYWR
nr:hypothetical protein CFP56_68694 [Quercus suber]